jgi:DNA excision repair protein ERCC-2
MLEMQSGNTVCLLSLIISYIQQKSPETKLVYCTKTTVEMEKVIEELKFVQQQREQDFKDENQELGAPFLGLTLSGKTHLCIEKTVSKAEDSNKLESLCREKTAKPIVKDIEDLASP